MIVEGFQARSVALKSHRVLVVPAILELRFALGDVDRELEKPCRPDHLDLEIHVGILPKRPESGHVGLAANIMPQAS